MSESRIDPRIIDADVLSRDGARVGKVTAVILDRDLTSPAFVDVKRSVLPGRHSYVPYVGSRLDEDGALVVPFDEATIEAAPRPELTGGTFDPEQSRLLHAHYGTRGPGSP